MKKILAILSIIFIATLHAAAQKVVSGTVRDSKGEPVVGAVVMLEGTQAVATMTSASGQWHLSIPEPLAGKSLTVSCLSYKTATIPLGKEVVYDLKLEDDTELLDEVVVVGYGAMRRSDLTGSVTSVKINEDDASQSTSLDQLIQGHAAGVQMVNASAAPDAGVNITVRGMTSLSGNSQPLFVVDGVMLTTNESVTMLDPGDENYSESGNSLLGLNPQDIASIEILKDASATAIYGSEGANGVILITTKMADREKPRIRFSTGIDLVNRYKRFDTLTFDEYVTYLEENTANTASLPQLKRMFTGYVSPTERGELKVTPIDWQDYTMRNTVRQRYYFSVAGHPGTLSYNFSIGYNNTPGVVKTTGLEQFTIRLNAEKQILEKLKIGTKVNFAKVSSHAQQGAASGGSISTSMMRSMLISRPYFQSTDEDDDDDWEVEAESNKSTPARWLKDSYSNTDQLRITPNIYLQWDINSWLTFKLSGGGDYNMKDITKWRGPSVNYATTAAYAAVSEAETIRWNVDALLMFNKKWRSHSLSGTVGVTTDNHYINTQAQVGYNIKQYKIQSDAVNSAPNANLSYIESRTNTLSYFARAVYNYRDRYVLTGTIRVDGSSKFQDGNKFATFPSFAAAWRINQEPWFRVKAISMAKLRLGWGEVGNSGVRPYQTFTTFSSTKYPSHDVINEAGYSRAMDADNLANATLKWETTTQWNAGIDLGLFHGRISLSADAYYKRTYDLLNTKMLPYASGYTKIYVNQGEILNRGLEFTLEATPVKTRDFEWNLDANISINRNKIINIGTDSDGDGIFLSPGEYVRCNYYPGDKLGSGRYFDAYANVFIEGQPMGLFYGLLTDGIIQEGETGPGFTSGTTRGPGYIKYRDLDGNGYIDNEDRTIIGDPNPDFTFGFGTSLSYKKWTLKLNFNGSFGNDICNTNFNVLADTGYTTIYNISKRVYDGAWVPGRTDAIYPQLGKFEPNGDSSKFSNLNVEDGSYLRLASVGLTYTIPLKKFIVKSINLGASVSNVYVWTKYSGWDPEVSSYGANSRKIGIDSGSYPGSRTFCFDVKFAF